MKRCANKNCSQPQPLSPDKFNKRVGVADGLQPYCRVCQSMSNSKNRKPKVINNREMHKAQRRVRYAMNKGRIAKTPCAICGTTINLRMYLAPSLIEPLRPTWYCPSHHPNRSGSRKDPFND